MDHGDRFGHATTDVRGPRATVVLHVDSAVSALYVYDIGQYADAHYTHTRRSGDVPKGTAPIANDQVSVAWSRRRLASAGASESLGLGPEPVSYCSLSSNLHGPRRAAEVCKWVQLSSGSSVYPVRHGVLCLLPA